MEYLRKALKDSEVLNVVDEDGTFLTTVDGGIVTVARAAAHAYGIFHQTSNILAVIPSAYSGEPQIVLQRRSKSKQIFPGALTISCGGHMGTAIDPKKAAIREAEEELNLKVKNERLISLGDAVSGCRNLLRIWNYLGTRIIQMGKDAKVFTDAANGSIEVTEYIQTLPSHKLPGDEAPKGLNLEMFNREFCFYYLHLVSESELYGVKFTDGEVEGFQKVKLSEFLNSPESEMTDSTLTLFQNVDNLKEIVVTECKQRVDG